MNYSLGNTLSRGGALNPDGLSLDLQFATDKTLVARKGPTPTFTRASTATFVGSNGLIQSAAINQARFDHDPSTLVSRGLLIEESRTNLVLQSENHPSATWNKTGLTVASAGNTDPAGAATSNLVSEDVSVGLHRLFQSTAYVSGTSYSISVFLKYAGRQFVAISHPAVASNNVAIFDIQNGTITLSQASITSSITSYPNGWYRCVVNGVSATTGGASHIIQGSTTGGILTGSYLGLNGPAFYIYGSQVEAGAFPTSYIPTTTASVVRSADVCSITGSAFTSFYNNAAGTFVSESMIANLTGNNRGIAQIDSGTTVDIIRHNYALSDGGFTSNIRANTDTPTVFAVVAGAASVIQKRAIAYEGTSFASATNGGAVATVTRTFPVGLNTMRIGSLTSGGFVLTGHIAAIKFYKKRLPNAKLQALTT